MAISQWFLFSQASRQPPFSSPSSLRFNEGLQMNKDRWPKLLVNHVQQHHICTYRGEMGRKTRINSVPSIVNKSKKNISWKLLPHKENLEKGLISLPNTIKFDRENKKSVRLTNMYRVGMHKKKYCKVNSGKQAGDALRQNMWIMRTLKERCMNQSKVHIIQIKVWVLS